MDRKFKFEKTSDQSISSFKNLCKTLDISEKFFLSALDIPLDLKYKKNEIPRPNGRPRTVFNPHYQIRKIQNRINNRIFKPKKGRNISWPIYLYGSIPNELSEDNVEIKKDYIACVRNHCLAKSVLKIDVEDFFNHVSYQVVYDIFRSFFSYSEEVSSYLSDICCYKGFLVQGALTSSYLASLCFHDLEPDLFLKVTGKGLKYTRLLDDITISSKNVNYNFDYVKQIVIDMLYKKELPVNYSKTKVYRFSSEPLLVHGLRISFKEPRLPKYEVSNIRASVKNIELIAKEPMFRVTFNYRKEFFKCLGRVNKLKRLGHNQHKTLCDRLKAVAPRPSKKDVKKCDSLIKRLYEDYEDKKTNYWYFKRYHLTLDRIYLVSLSYPNRAERMKEALKNVKPIYEK